MDTTNIYSHRNGETEPPTIYEEFYWHERVIGSKYDDEDAILFVMPPEDDIGAYIYSNSHEINGRIPISEIEGRWWGPVIPPWSDNGA